MVGFLFVDNVEGQQAEAGHFVNTPRSGKPATTINQAMHIYALCTVQYQYHRKRIYTEEKAKVVTAAWGQNLFNSWTGQFEE